MPDRFADFSLRDRKRAQTRVALAQSLLARLSESPLEAVAVDDLAADASISPATFYKYFPTKADLLTHTVQLWSLEMALVARDVEASAGSPLAAIEVFFAATAAKIGPYPKVMLEIIRHQAHERGAPPPPVEPVERLLHLRDDPEAAQLPEQGMDALLLRWIAAAVAQGELPATAQVDVLMLGAASIFFGVPLLLGRETPALIGPMYQALLQKLWAGARASDPRVAGAPPPNRPNEV